MEGRPHASSKVWTLTEQRVRLAEEPGTWCAAQEEVGGAPTVRREAPPCPPLLCMFPLSPHNLLLYHLFSSIFTEMVVEGETSGRRYYLPMFWWVRGREGI